MKKTAFAIAATVSALGFATAALAHEMDTDEDGLYSLTELRAEYPDLTDVDYAGLDTNSDGAVDGEELAAAQADGRLAPLD
ncbi:hypothetical protein LCGC14_1907440 [marine sediment metagenome]|uniref:EF-hand domain-containing protein n=2 Tax=root TaxID=1 RepID=A0A9C9TGB7_9HYPH|nr:EF-hand domain-containing protein [Aurantimonas coralicida]